MLKALVQSAHTMEPEIHEFERFTAVSPLPASLDPKAPLLCCQTKEDIRFAPPLQVETPGGSLVLIDRQSWDQATFYVCRQAYRDGRGPCIEKMNKSRDMTKMPSLLS